MMKNICPVCGFPDLDEPAYHSDLGGSYEICPCCGTEFGYDDAGSSIPELRQRWKDNGCRWWSSSSPPINWNPALQLGNIRGQEIEIISKKEMDIFKEVVFASANGPFFTENFADTFKCERSYINGVLSDWENVDLSDSITSWAIFQSLKQFVWESGAGFYLDVEFSWNRQSVNVDDFPQVVKKRWDSFFSISPVEMRRAMRKFCLNYSHVYSPAV